jgi:GDPmannose 4,6-dehydratase
MTKAIITGITGQDGSYLAELLLNKDYEVIGCFRRSSTNSLHRIKHLLHNPKLKLTEFDLTDPSVCNQLISHEQPHEFYNLAAQSHVGTSFSQPSTTFEINSIGVVNILESIRHFSPHTKLYQASTSEMFGRNYSIKDTNGLKYQNEKTTMLPQSPYGIAKLSAHHMVEVYRSGYNIFGCCGILFNHESPRRGENFVTRKITKYIGQVVRGETTEKLKLGNLDAHRDWGHAKDYVEAMWMMLQHSKPLDLVIATGSTHAVADFLNEAFELVNLDPKAYVDIDPSLFRPAEVDYLCGDPSLAKETIGWSPSISFNDLVKDMVESDIKNAS